MLIPVQPASRGALTDELKKFYFEKTTRELTKRELRLLPYILHCSLNNGSVTRVNAEEIVILESLDEAGFIFYSRSGELLALTDEYFDIICEVVKNSYLTKAEEI